MKVLWFSNTSANADEYFNSELRGTGGWLKALDQQLQGHVELHIAFYGTEERHFKYGKTTYHSLKWSNNLFKQLLTYYRGSIPNSEHLKRYLSIIEEVQPDIIHIHGTENAFGCILKHVNIPVVVSIQGIITVIHHKYFSGFEKRYLSVKKRSVTNLKGFLFPRSFMQKLKKFRKMQIRETINLRNVKFILGRTDWDKRVSRVLAPQSAYYHEERVLRSSFYLHQWELPSNSKTVIHTTSSNNSYKGFETVCQALYELNQIHFKCEWHVTGIAEGDLIVKLTRKMLKSKYPEQGLILNGKLNGGDLIKKMLKSDLYVMPSHIENNVNSLSEAMILGMPCLSTFVGGVGSLITDRVDGILIQDGDPWAMAGAILELSNNKKQAIALGQNARKTALSRHNRTEMVQNLLKTYQDIIKVSKV